MNLLPCPFCGDLPEIKLYTHNSVKPDSWYVWCNCGMAQAEDYAIKNEAIVVWDTRTVTTSSIAEGVNGNTKR